MSNFIKLTAESNLPGLNEAKEFSCGGKEICVANVNGTYSAMDNICLHRGGPLGQGMLDGPIVMCPWHAWTWNVVTGENASNPELKIATYPVKVEGGDVLVQVD